MRFANRAVRLSPGGAACRRPLALPVAAAFGPGARRMRGERLPAISASSADEPADSDGVSIPSIAVTDQL